MHVRTYLATCLSKLCVCIRSSLVLTHANSTALCCILHHTQDEEVPQSVSKETEPEVNLKTGPETEPGAEPLINTKDNATTSNKSMAVDPTEMPIIKVNAKHRALLYTAMSILCYTMHGHCIF
jgi:hypothetical protein